MWHTSSKPKHLYCQKRSPCSSPQEKCHVFNTYLTAWSMSICATITELYLYFKRCMRFPSSCGWKVEHFSPPAFCCIMTQLCIIQNYMLSKSWLTLRGVALRWPSAADRCMRSCSRRDLADRWESRRMWMTGEESQGKSGKKGREERYLEGKSSGREEK